MAARFSMSNSLRVIGQLLEQQGLDLYELQFGDDEVFVQCGGPTSPYLDLINFNYTLTHIRSLDQQAKVRRRPSFTLVRFEGLPETLRAIGRHMEEEGAELLRVCNSSSSPYESITIEYRTRDRRRHEQEILASSLRDHAMRMYKERSSINARLFTAEIAK